MTSIAWTDETWNPTLGCSRVSPGCEHCYAERFAHRGLAPEHKGLTVMGKHGPRWTGEVRRVPARLDQPLRWRKPRRIFVNSMSDLFHPNVPFEYVAAVFGVMAAAPRHTFQILTKRPERAAEFFAWIADQMEDCLASPLHVTITEAAGYLAKRARLNINPRGPWPLRNVWLGVSVEDQATADARIPVLLECPAALRFVSYEPALGPVDFRLWLDYCERLDKHGILREPGGQHIKCERHCGISWLIVGGESGPGARPFDLADGRSAIAQCKAAGVPVFFKQAGAKVRGLPNDPTAIGVSARGHLRLRHRSGADPSEWPQDLRVQEWPEERA